jgi:hypothetical protein
MESLYTFIELAIVFILMGIVPGSIAWRLIVKNQTKIDAVIFGSIMGLVLMAFGGVLSSWTQTYYARFIPSVFLISIGVLYRKRSWFNSATKQDQSSLIISGAFLGFISILAQLVATLRSQPTSWEGWWSFYGDLSWHVALTSEVLSRPPSTFPWFPGTELHYTWMVHSALGVWGSATTASADFMVLQAWPILFSILLPLSISTLAYAVSKQKYVVLMAPSVVALLVGPVGIQETVFAYAPTYSISPTHELSQILIITIIMALFSQRNFQELETSMEKYLSAIILFVLFFTAAGSKGVMPLFIVSTIGSFWTYCCLRRTANREHHLTLALALAAVLLSIFTVIGNTSNGLDIQPLSLLTGYADEPNLRSYLSLICFFIWIAAAALAAWRSDIELQIFAAIVTIPITLSVVATFMFSHPGRSQSYFYMSTIPVLVVLILSSLSKLSSSKDGTHVIATGFIAYAIHASILIVPSTWSEREKLMSLFAIPLVSSFFYLTVSMQKYWRVDFRKTFVYIFMTIALTSFFAQPFIFKSFVYSGNESSGSENNVSNQLIGDMRTLKEFSNTNDLVATNRICEATSPNVYLYCGPHYWYLSGYSERKIFFETYAFTWEHDQSEAEDRITQNSEFILNASNENTKAMWEFGVRWIFIDKSRPYKDYSNVADLKLDTASSQIWRVLPPK